MVSRKHETSDALLHDNLQLLRSVTHSQATNDASIVVDASNYIRELKHKVERLKDEIDTGQSSSLHQNLRPTRVNVETLENGGFVVKISSGTASPRLLVSIFATIEEMGLNVVEARVSCGHSFHLQALADGHGHQHNEAAEEGVDARSIKRAISTTIKNCSTENIIED